MRVTSGVAGGVPLFVPRTGQIRPTMDQVRAAIFSSLAEAVPGANVLDLFAGAGSLGIEALSRGARAVTFIEHDRAAADCIRRNLEKTKLAAGGRVLSQDVFAFFRRRLQTGESRECFDLIFADPPYTTRAQPVDFAGQLLTSAGLAAALSIDGIFILEKSPRHQPLLDPACWETLRQKRYGSSEILFLKRVPGSPPFLPTQI